MQTMWQTISRKIREGWKAVVALLIPIAFGAAAEMIDAITRWMNEQGYVWGGIAIGILSAIGVWLKRNQPSA